MIKVVDLVRRFFNFLSDETILEINSFIVGKTVYVVFENINHEGFINNNLIKNIIKKELNFYYFTDYKNFEYYFANIDFNESYCFVLIG